MTNTTPAGAGMEPCPYCATTPHPKDHVEWEAHVVEYAIRCPNCGALGPNDISLDRAREMWNLRRTASAHHEQLQQRVQELEAQVAELEQSCHALATALTTEEIEIEDEEDDIEAAIKPCPKCGGKAILEGTWNDEIVCTECGLWSGEDMDSLEEAIEWWNKQPLVERLTAQHEQLQQRVQELESQAANWEVSVHNLAIAGRELCEDNERLKAERDALAAKVAELKAQVDADGMLEFINDVHREHIERLQSEVERLRAGSYQPVPDGEYDMGGDTILYIFGNTDPDVCTWVEYGDETAMLDLGMTICQWQPAQDTQPGDGQE